jgi:hypothetical protein
MTGGDMTGRTSPSASRGSIDVKTETETETELPLSLIRRRGEGGESRSTRVVVGVLAMFRILKA